MRWKCCGEEANADDLFCPDCTDEDGVFDDDDDDGDDDDADFDDRDGCDDDFDLDEDDADDLDCGAADDDTSVSQCEDCGEWAVFWNEYNAATQCHACGLAEENA